MTMQKSGQRMPRWGAVDEVQKAAGAAELREMAGDRPDLLAEVAGVSLGSSEGKVPEYRAHARAIAELYRAAGADEGMIPAWIEEGRRRAEAARRRPPFSGGVRPSGCPARVGHDYASGPSRCPGAGHNAVKGGK